MRDELTTVEVMKLLGISRRTVQEYVKAGRLTVTKDVRGRNIFSHEQVRREMAVRIALPTSPNIVQATFTFDPQNQVMLDRVHYEGLLTRLAQLETELRILREQNRLIEDRRSWWRKLLSH